MLGHIHVVAHTDTQQNNKYVKPPKPLSKSSGTAIKRKCRLFSLNGENTRTDFIHWDQYLYNNNQYKN